MKRDSQNRRTQENEKRRADYGSRDKAVAETKFLGIASIETLMILPVEITTTVYEKWAKGPPTKPRSENGAIRVVSSHCLDPRALYSILHENLPKIESITRNDGSLPLALLVIRIFPKIIDWSVTIAVRENVRQGSELVCQPGN